MPVTTGMEILNYATLKTALPNKPADSHKGLNGHVVIVGAGSMQFSGAVCLAAAAAMRSGVGLVSAIVAPESLPLMTRSLAEVMYYGVKSFSEVAQLALKANVLLIGSGLSQNHWAQDFFHKAINVATASVIDADGLNLLAKLAQPLKRDNWILTPHPKEAARLLNINNQLEVDVHSVQQDRLTAIKRLHDKFGGVIVLKGADTLIIDHEKNIFLQPGGTPSLSTAGTGDVLAGTISGLVAQGMPLAAAAKLAVITNVMAAENEQLLGVRGMIASDLLPHLRSLLNVW